jgi:hypothetical protein
MTWLTDDEHLLDGMRERTEQLLDASRRTRLDLAEAAHETLGAVADAHDKLADASEVEWMARLLRAQASFTRSVGEASARFARDLLAEG